MQRLVAVVLVVAVLLAGCTSLVHLDDTDCHIWHSYPARFGGNIVGLVTLPIFIVIGFCRGDILVPDDFTSVMWGYWTGAILVGGPFYLLGLPFEGAESQPKDAPIAPADTTVPSDEVLRQRDEVIEDAQRGDR